MTVSASHEGGVSEAAERGRAQRGRVEARPLHIKAIGDDDVAIFNGVCLPVGPSDIVTRLRGASPANIWANPELLKEAAEEILRLRRELHHTKQERVPNVQYDLGYRQAQTDIRRALGIDE